LLLRRHHTYDTSSIAAVILTCVSPLTAAIPSPSTDVIHLGPFTVHIYGLCYSVAVIAAVAIVRRRWEAQGGSRDLVYDVALWGFPAGLIGGRLYYLLTTPGDSLDHWWGPFAVWEGGLGIWGGIVLGTLVGIWRVRRADADVAAFLDAAAPALLVAEAIGRVGNYFNQELFGRPSDLPWAVEIDVEHRPARYLSEPTFHPTFLYEATWNLLLAGALVWLGRHRAIRPPGLSPSTSRATARSGSSTSCCASTQRRTSSVSAGTCCWRSAAPSPA
jgi:prolipoprotein diacylglyceryl transferase